MLFELCSGCVVRVGDVDPEEVVSDVSTVVSTVVETVGSVSDLLLFLFVAIRINIPAVISSKNIRMTIKIHLICFPLSDLMLSVCFSSREFIQ